MGNNTPVHIAQVIGKVDKIAAVLKHVQVDGAAIGRNIDLA